MKVRAYATIRDVIGASVNVTLQEGADVERLLDELVKLYGKSFSERILDERGELLPYVKLLVNGRDVDFLKGLRTTLKDGDEVALFPPVGGGGFERGAGLRAAQELDFLVEILSYALIEHPSFDRKETYFASSEAS